MGEGFAVSEQQYINQRKQLNEALAAYDMLQKPKEKKARFFSKKQRNETQVSVVTKKCTPLAVDLEYQLWIEENESHSTVDVKEMPTVGLFAIGKFGGSEFFERTLASLERQNYPGLDIIRIGENDSVADILENAGQEYVGFIMAGDTLADNALSEMMSVVDYDSKPVFLYSDEDCIRKEDGLRYDPRFKPEWSEDTLLAYDYCGQLAIFDKEALLAAGGINEELGRYFIYDATLRVTEKASAKQIAHIPKVLYHGLPYDRSKAKDYLLAIKTGALQRRGIRAHLEWMEDMENYRVVYEPVGEPLVSVVILSKDNKAILKQAVDSITALTSYPNYEIIVVDNGSADREGIAEMLAGRAEYIYEPMDFNFSAQCNIGVKASKGEYILLLNDDIEIIQPDWLTRMLGAACQPHIGAVGAKLYYPDSRNIQHAGILNLALGPGHLLFGCDDSEVLCGGRNRYDYNYIAVTGAALMCSKDKYIEVGMLDEDLPVAYNDVDFCMSLLEHGYSNVLKNDVVAYHYESYSRKDDKLSASKRQRLATERKYLYDKHNLVQGVDTDPYYSVNYSQESHWYDLKKPGSSAIEAGYRLLTEMEGSQIECELRFRSEQKDNLIKFTLSYESKDSAFGRYENKSILLKLNNNHIFEIDAYCVDGKLYGVIDSAVFSGETRDFAVGIKFASAGECVYAFGRDVWSVQLADSLFGSVVCEGKGDPAIGIVMSIDTVSKENDESHTFIKGWALDSTEMDNNRCYLRYLVYECGDVCRKVRLYTNLRSDMVGIHSTYLNALYIGFETTIPSDETEKLTEDTKWYLVYEDMRTHAKKYTEIEIPIP